MPDLKGTEGVVAQIGVAPVRTRFVGCLRAGPNLLAWNVRTRLWSDIFLVHTAVEVPSLCLPSPTGSGGLVHVLLFPPYSPCPGGVLPSKPPSDHALSRGHDV